MVPGLRLFVEGCLQSLNLPLWPLDIIVLAHTLLVDQIVRSALKLLKCPLMQVRMNVVEPGKHLKILCNW